MTLSCPVVCALARTVFAPESRELVEGDLAVAVWIERRHRKVQVRLRYLPSPKQTPRRSESTLGSERGRAPERLYRDCRAALKHLTLRSHEESWQGCTHQHARTYSFTWTLRTHRRTRARDTSEGARACKHSRTQTCTAAHIRKSAQTRAQAHARTPFDTRAPYTYVHEYTHAQVRVR